MTDKSFLKYAEDNQLIPISWFNINYPAYAVKVKYKYPTADPADFRDRALLQLIDLGVPYATACAILMIDDPHQAIFKRFKSDNPGPQLIKFDSNRHVLTPIGRQRVERIELARDGVACCFIDGFTGEPFPFDVVDSLSERFDCSEVKYIQGGLYPFEAGIDNKIVEINAKLNEGKGNNYRKRLRLPDKASETTMIPLGEKWMKNLSVGIFIKNGEVVRHIFCDKMKRIEKFGWLMSLSGFKLTIKNNLFTYTVGYPIEKNVFSFETHKTGSKALKEVILSIIRKDFGTDFVEQCDLEVDLDKGECCLDVKSLNDSITKRSRILSFIEKGILPLRLSGMTGSLFINVKASQSLNDLGSIRRWIDESELDWHDIIKIVQKSYPTDWRKILIDIDRHDLLFRHDLENFIHYGK